jgi:TolB protein
MKKALWLLPVGLAGMFVLWAQQPDMRIDINKPGGLPVIAIPDFKGAGEAQKFMAAFNDTLYGDVSGSGYFKMAPKSLLPSFVPQQPSDFVTTPGGPRGQMMSDWSGPGVGATYLAFGYTGVANGLFVLYGNLYDLRRDTPANAKVIDMRHYQGDVSEAGARKVAHEFAADIIAMLGGQSMFGTHIYFVSNRTGHKEIWVMDPDGKNQKQITHFNSTSIEPSVSPDGTKIAFTSYKNVTPGIFVFSVDPVRDLRFYNQRASVNSSPSFTPDGNQIVYSSSAPNDKCCRIFIANLNGQGFRPITGMSAIDTEPKANPKTGREIVFASGRSGPEQIYRMTIEGTDIERLSDGTGEAANPAWHPNGEKIAYAWTRGYAAGAWNVFIMDVASRNYVQLTHGDGKNEHPSWAPDGTHIVFAKTRGHDSQIYTMLADGNQVQQLTTSGSNERPVWGK